MEFDLVKQQAEKEVAEEKFREEVNLEKMRIEIRAKRKFFPWRIKIVSSEERVESELYKNLYRKLFAENQNLQMHFDHITAKQRLGEPYYDRC